MNIFCFEERFFFWFNLLDTVEKNITAYKIGCKVKYRKCIVSKMEKVYLFVAMAMAIPVLMATTLNYNIQMNPIQAFAQNNNNSNNSIHTISPKDIVNMTTPGQKVVLRGMVSSESYNNWTLKTGDKPHAVSILPNRPDGTIYTGIMTFTATKPVEVGISYSLPIDNSTLSAIDTKTFGNLDIGYRHDKVESGFPGDVGTLFVIVPDYGTESPYFSASIPFVGDSLWLRTLHNEPFIAAYAVSADIVQPLNVLKLDSATNATKANTTYNSQ